MNHVLLTNYINFCTAVPMQLLYRRYSGNFLVNLLGKWKESEYSGQSIPVGGIAYYITAPSRLSIYLTHLFYMKKEVSVCHPSLLFSIVPKLY